MDSWAVAIIGTVASLSVFAVALAYMYGYHIGYYRGYKDGIQYGAKQLQDYHEYTMGNLRKLREDVSKRT